MIETSIKQCTQNVVQEVVREKQVVAMTDILYLLPELLECVEVDREYLRNRVANVLNKKTANPINSLLSLLDLRIVNIHKTIDGCIGTDDYVEVDAELNGCRNQHILTIAPKRVQAIIEQIAELLVSAEAEQNDRISVYSGHSSQLVGRLNAIEKQYAQLQLEHDVMRKDILATAQSMLSAAVQENSSMAKYATELLEDLGAQAYWSAENSDYSESAMFNKYFYDNPDAMPSKPCIVGKDGILIKGVKYVVKRES